ncbi:phospholipase A [Variovorax sp. OV329]|uniref:phospholipase A n=1 Tax=Variovorax sp. OV329 TaxID=1882825 RepID=UPI0008E53DAD|nr:phospholipase A [Variovorax sp. OV329]SFN24267.1 phospholipase A1 [Variovorax sp. OV329]
MQTSLRGDVAAAGLLATSCAFLILSVTPARAQAQDASSEDLGWQQCQRITGDKDARLNCFDRWSNRQMLQPSAGTTAAPAAARSTPPPVVSAPATSAASANAASAEANPIPVDASQPVTRIVEASGDACRDRQYSTLSRFWELEDGTSCGTFGLRGYRPIDVTFAMATDRPQTPTSPAPNHTGTPQDYQPGEMRLNLSLRTKVAQGLLTGADPTRKDSLWFGYTQQSTWQVFNSELSRPFRTTDHEPEMMYVYPTDLKLPGGWRWRYAGAGIAHQSNGQSDPYSRSWNRIYLMGGIELDNRFVFNARAWKRISEDPENDDNPDITDYIGRVELSGWWYPDAKNAIGLTWRTWGKGSQRLEYTRAIGDPATTNLRFVAQIFHGYGDTLVDYNRSRTVFGVGLRLVDF